MTVNVEGGCDMCSWHRLPPSPYRSLMAGATHNNRERRAEARRPTADDQFPERLAASMQRHRRILDRLAGEAE